MLITIRNTLVTVLNVLVAISNMLLTISNVVLQMFTNQQQYQKLRLFLSVEGWVAFSCAILYHTYRPAL
jgi:hypothetical protein